MPRRFRLLIHAVALTGALVAGNSCRRGSSIKPEARPNDTAASGEAKDPTQAADSSATPKTQTGASTQPKIRNSPPPAELWKEFSGEKAMAEVQKQVAFGPRPAGSLELVGARKTIITSLQNNGWTTEVQEFTGTTPRGSLHFANIIARHGAADGKPPTAAIPQAIVCSHYDTKRFSTISFVGASDGASSTGALVELSRVLVLDPDLASKVELVFFDGEEAVQDFTDTDGLYGSRHYASSLQAAGRAKQFKFAILWDMIGDKDLTITLPPNSPAKLAQGIMEAAEALHLRQHFSYLSRSITDDHVPLADHGIPAIDLIDFDYFPWHTADDTLDKLSPESLQKVGAVTVYYLKKALAQ